MLNKQKKSFFDYIPLSDLLTYAILIVAFTVITTILKINPLLISYTDRGLLVPVCYSIMLAVSLNLVVGFLGELSLGHAAFMSAGAYAGCIFATQMVDIAPSMPVSIRFILALVIGGVVAALFGVLVGVPILRLRGDYLAIVTLAFGEILKGIIQLLDIKKTIVVNGVEIEKTVIDGSMGLRTKTINDANFTIAFILVMITVVVVLNIKRSKIGRAVMAVRDNRIAAEACGINVAKYKLIIFVLAAFFAGVAGVLYGHYETTIDPRNFDFNYSIDILVFVVLGGMGSIRGSIFAATILTILPQKLTFLVGGWKTLVYALLLIFIMLFSGSPKMVAVRERLNLKKLITFSKKEAVINE